VDQQCKYSVVCEYFHVRRLRGCTPVGVPPGFLKGDPCSFLVDSSLPFRECKSRTAKALLVLVVVLSVNPLGTSRRKRTLVTSGKSVQSTNDGTQPISGRLNIKWWRPPHWLLCCPRTSLHSSLRWSDESVTSKRAVCPNLLQKGMVAVSIYQARSIGDEMCVV
jgi:hypothetical protein